MHDAANKRQADGAIMPGLRFWWEYLECSGFERNFYYMLATEQKQAGAQSGEEE